MKPIIWTRHAREPQEDRQDRVIPDRLVELTAREPDWREADVERPEVERRFRSHPELEGRVLRVACAETKAHIRIITFHLDRNARRKRRAWTSLTTPKPTP